MVADRVGRNRRIAVVRDHVSPFRMENHWQWTWSPLRPRALPPRALGCRSAYTTGRRILNAPKEFTEPVGLSSTRPIDLPLPRRAFRLSFDLVALRARYVEDTMVASRPGQARSSSNWHSLRRSFSPTGRFPSSIACRAPCGGLAGARALIARSRPRDGRRINPHARVPAPACAKADRHLPRPRRS